MDRSLLLKVVKALGSKEKSQLESFLKLDLFNKGKSADGIVNLWIILSNCLKTAPKKPISKEDVFQKLFPGQEFHLGQLEKLMSKLLQLIYQFIHITAENSTENHIKKQINIYKFLMSNDLIAAGQARSKSIAKLLSDAKSTTGYYYLELLHQKSISDFASLRNNRNKDLNLPECLDSLDNFHLFYKLELTLQLLSLNQWLSPQNIKKTTRKLDQALQEIPSKLQKDPIFQIYFHAYRLLKEYFNSNEKEFKIFQKKLLEYEAHCHPAQLKAFQALSRNYCIQSYRKGNRSFITIGYELYKKHLEEGLLYYRGKILTGTFCNLVLLANWEKDFLWAKTFVEDHRHLISGVDDPEEIYRFNLAVNEFYSNSFDNALDLIAPNYQDRYVKFAAKRLEIMALYELNSDLFEHRLEAFKVFVYRLDMENNLLITKDENKKFVGILKQIKHPKSFDNKTRIQKLLKKIDSFKYVSDRLWLREKVEELK